MADVVFVALLIGFFALSAAFVRACERILDDGEPDVFEVTDSDEAVAA